MANDIVLLTETSFGVSCFEGMVIDVTGVLIKCFAVNTDYRLALFIVSLTYLFVGATSMLDN